MGQKKMGTLLRRIIIVLLLALIFCRDIKSPWVIACIIGGFAVLLFANLMPWHRRIARWVSSPFRHARSYFEKQKTNAEYAMGAVEQQNNTNIALLHLNCRISDKLKSAFPDATWDWQSDHPETLALHGGTARIALHQAGHYTNGEVAVDNFARITFTLMEMIELEQFKRLSDNNSAKDVPDVSTITDVIAWYDLVGQTKIQEIVTELNARGYQKMFIETDGGVAVLQGDTRVLHAKLENLPAKHYWNELADLLIDSGLNTTIDDQSLLVSWAA